MSEFSSAKFYEFLTYYSKDKNIEAIIIGAMDGISHDNIKDFVHNENWKLVFVEPVKKYINKLKDNFGESDRFYFVNKAISNKNEMTQFIMFDPDKVDDNIINNGMAGLTTIYPPKNCLTGFLGNDEYKNYIKMEDFECISVKNLLDEIPFKFINYLQIDTEGYDWMIFEQFDLSDIKFVKIEHSSLNQYERSALIEKLEKNGFTYSIESEDIFAMNWSENE